VAAGPFIEAVKRVSLVAERASPVQLAFGPGLVVVEAQAEGRARAVETVAADFEGDEPVIAFNPHYLLDGLAAAAAAGTALAGPARAAGTPADGGEAPSEPGGRIRIEFTSPAKPALITWAAASRPVSGEQDDGESGEQREPAAGEQDGTDSAPDDGESAPDDAESVPDDAENAPEVAAFRYLVVPLRVPAKG
jgi:DNA polymerase III sliding clamp (beta) subunit (PCNA family)